MMLISAGLMRKSDRRERGRNNRAQAARRRMYAHMVILILLTVGVFAIMAFFYPSDGGYVVETAEINGSGKMVAA
jgi:hypothetical protein